MVSTVAGARPPITESEDGPVPISCGSGSGRIKPGWARTGSTIGCIASIRGLSVSTAVVRRSLACTSCWSRAGRLPRANLHGGA